MSFEYPLLLWLLIPSAIAFFRFKPLRPLIATALLCVIALANPYLLKPNTTQAPPARHITVAIDVSASMFANDLHPDRYRFAKNTLFALLKKLRNDHVSVYVFTQNALMLSPPTTDYKLVRNALEAFDPSYVLSKSTSLARTLRQLIDQGLKDETLILFTDGGEEKNLKSLAPMLKQAGVSLIVVATATPRGTLLKNGTKPLLDEKGNLVVSRLNPKLQQLVKYANGTLIQADTSPAQTAQTVIQSLPSDTHTSKTHSQHRQSLRAIALGIALLIILSAYTSLSRSAIALMALISSAAQGGAVDMHYLFKGYECYRAKEYRCALEAFERIKDHSIESLYALSSAYYQNTRYDSAIAVLRTIQTNNPRLKSIIWHNMGNALLLSGQCKEALEAYQNALMIRYDSDTAHNYRFAKGYCAQTRPPLPPQTPRTKTAPKGQNTPSQEDSQSHKQSSSLQGQTSSLGASSNKHAQTDRNTSRTTPNTQTHPYASKVYEIINKGYIYETRPW